MSAEQERSGMVCNLRRMCPRQAIQEPSQAIAIDGEVVVMGPEGVAHAFTPQAARETSERLRAAAEEASAPADRCAADEPSKPHG